MQPPPTVTASPDVLTLAAPHIAGVTLRRTCAYANGVKYDDRAQVRS